MQVQMVLRPRQVTYAWVTYASPPVGRGGPGVQAVVRPEAGARRAAVFAALQALLVVLATHFQLTLQQQLHLPLSPPHSFRPRSCLSPFMVHSAPAHSTPAAAAGRCSACKPKLCSVRPGPRLASRRLQRCSDMRVPRWWRAACGVWVWGLPQGITALWALGAHRVEGVRGPKRARQCCEVSCFGFGDCKWVCTLQFELQSSFLGSR